MERTFHIVDIENIAGEHHRDPATLAAATQMYKLVAGIASGDQALVGCDAAPMHRLTVGLLWPGARTVAGFGPDGADRALLSAVDERWLVARRFSRVVIGSGDRAFGPLAARLRSEGMFVEVVAPSRRCHWSLYRAAFVRVITSSQAAA